MISLIRKGLNIIILSLTLSLMALAVNYLAPGAVEKSSLIILIVSFLILSLIVVGLAHAGLSRSAESQLLYSFGAVGLKFLLSAAIALIYFTGFKKDGLNNIILFFVLYLTFAIYVIAAIVKALNVRSLKSDKV